MIVVFVIGLWISAFLTDLYAKFIFTILFSGYFFYRFKKKGLIVCFIILSLLQLMMIPSWRYPEKGNYQVYEIKTNYVIARNQENTDILIYGLENPLFYDVYQIEHFKKIEGQGNIGVFSFPNFMAGKGIYYSSYSNDSQLIERKSCLKNKIYKWISKKDNSAAMKIFYGQYSENLDFINKLGLPILAFFSFTEKMLRRKYKYEMSNMITIVAGCFFLQTFTVSASLVRWICFRLGKLYFNDWQKAFGFSFLLFWILMPESVTSFSFVFPTLLSLNYRFISDKKMRWIVSKCILMGCYVFFFGKIDLTMLFLFPIIRKFYTLSILFVLLSFVFPKLNVLWTVLDCIPMFEWYYAPGLLFSTCMVYIIFCLMKNQNKKSIYGMLSGLFLIFAQPYMDPFFSVYMIDIGQGDCTLIVEPFNKSAVMIDVGQNLYHDNVELFVEPFLKQKHIHSLDALIVTHDDFDHSGGVESLQERIDIKQIITTSDVKVPVDYPFYSLLSERRTTDENSKSIVSYFAYDNLEYLWTGDAGIDIENQILEQYDVSHADILKLGHHGSKTSSSFEFLDSIRPKLGLVSAGKNNRYGHPDSNVIANCHALGIHVLETKDTGMIQIKSWHQFAYFKTYNHLIGILKIG